MKTRSLSGEIHCGYCECPIEYYEPFKFFNSDRGCEVYSEALDIISDYPEMAFSAFYEKMLAVQERFTEIKHFKELCQEFYEIFEDTGVVESQFTDVKNMTRQQLIDEDKALALKEERIDKKIAKLEAIQRKVRKRIQKLPDVKKNGRIIPQIESRNPDLKRRRERE